MTEMIYGVNHVLSNHDTHDDPGMFAEGSADVVEEEVLTTSSVESDHSGSLNAGALVSQDDGSMNDYAEEAPATFEEEEGATADDLSQQRKGCAECGGNIGPFLSCGGCDLLYHNKCLMQCFLPSGEGSWKCPQCQWRLINAGEMPLDATLTHCDLSDESPSGYDDQARSHGPHEEYSDEASINDKEFRIKTSRSGSSPTREGPADILERKRKKPVTEGSNFQTKINVGFNHQVPFTPAFFLDDSLGPQPENHDWARLMYSPYYLEKIRSRKIQEGAEDSVIKNEFELAEFIQLCAQNWKNNPGWHPFSPEFAYKILHFADYDPKKALKVMNDPNFNFLCVCDPPTRRYDNKWKPKDRRGQVPASPYPPPVTLRGYLLRRHDASRCSENTVSLVYTVDNRCFRNVDYEILLVDDNSSDGTVNVYEHLQALYPSAPLKLLKRPGKMGLGSAYKDGLRHTQYDFVLILDADLSHHPKYIPEMIRLQRTGNYDIVSGTRYSRGGGASGWSLKRILISQTANTLAHFMLRPSLSDLTGSFRLYRRSLFEKLIEEVESKGYMFQIEVALRAEKHYNARISEVPIIFLERLYGSSKLGCAEIFGFIKGLFKLLWTI
ncbi:dolichol-phosphate-mannose synthase family protein [Babesia ovis]|uniref:dolichyl-phosphate beta-D-mannosyltransferase n=1 Tax=Babesia ovis TaxID=5869 RepID=A0A9W5TCB0_BABOV|nr:dolichol-phosphate-mannose synthase family protein [Babesia ovis]